MNERNNTSKPRCLYIGRRASIVERDLKRNYDLVYLGSDHSKNERIMKTVSFAYVHLSAHPEHDIATLRQLRRLQYTPSIIIVGADQDGHKKLDYRDLKALTRGISTEST